MSPVKEGPLMRLEPALALFGVVDQLRVARIVLPAYDEPSYTFAPTLDTDHELRQVLAGRNDDLFVFEEHEFDQREKATFYRLSKKDLSVQQTNTINGLNYVNWRQGTDFSRAIFYDTPLQYGDDDKLYLVIRASEGKATSTAVGYKHLILLRLNKDTLAVEAHNEIRIYERDPNVNFRDLRGATGPVIDATHLYTTLVWDGGTNNITSSYRYSLLRVNLGTLSTEAEVDRPEHIVKDVFSFAIVNTMATDRRGGFFVGVHRTNNGDDSSSGIEDYVLYKFDGASLALTAQVVVLSPTERASDNDALFYMMCDPSGNVYGELFQSFGFQNNEMSVLSWDSSLNLRWQGIKSSLNPTGIGHLPGRDLVFARLDPDYFWEMNKETGAVENTKQFFPGASSVVSENPVIDLIDPP